MKDSKDEEKNLEIISENNPEEYFHIKNIRDMFLSQREPSNVIYTNFQSHVFTIFKSEYINHGNASNDSPINDFLKLQRLFEIKNYHRKIDYDENSKTRIIYSVYEGKFSSLNEIKKQNGNSINTLFEYGKLYLFQIAKIVKSIYFDKLHLAIKIGDIFIDEFHRQILIPEFPKLINYDYIKIQSSLLKFWKQCFKIIIGQDESLLKMNQSCDLNNDEEVIKSLETKLKLCDSKGRYKSYFDFTVEVIKNGLEVFKNLDKLEINLFEFEDVNQGYKQLLNLMRNKFNNLNKFIEEIGPNDPQGLTDFKKKIEDKLIEDLKNLIIIFFSVNNPTSDKGAFAYKYFLQHIDNNQEWNLINLYSLCKFNLQSNNEQNDIIGILLEGIIHFTISLDNILKNIRNSLQFNHLEDQEVKDFNLSQFMNSLFQNVYSYNTDLINNILKMCQMDPECKPVMKNNLNMIKDFFSLTSLNQLILELSQYLYSRLNQNSLIQNQIIKLQPDKNPPDKIHSSLPETHKELIEKKLMAQPPKTFKLSEKKLNKTGKQNYEANTSTSNNQLKEFMENKNESNNYCVNQNENYNYREKEEEYIKDLILKLDSTNEESGQALELLEGKIKELLDIKYKFRRLNHTYYSECIFKNEIEKKNSQIINDQFKEISILKEENKKLEEENSSLKTKNSELNAKNSQIQIESDKITDSLHKLATANVNNLVIPLGSEHGITAFTITKGQEISKEQKAPLNENSSPSSVSSSGSPAINQTNQIIENFGKSCQTIEPKNSTFTKENNSFRNNENHSHNMNNRKLNSQEITPIGITQQNSVYAKNSTENFQSNSILGNEAEYDNKEQSKTNLHFSDRLIDSPNNKYINPNSHNNININALGYQAASKAQEQKSNPVIMPEELNMEKGTYMNRKTPPTVNYSSNYGNGEYEEENKGISKSNNDNSKKFSQHHSISSNFMPLSMQNNNNLLIHEQPEDNKEIFLKEKNNEKLFQNNSNLNLGDTVLTRYPNQIEKDPRALQFDNTGIFNLEFFIGTKEEKKHHLLQNQYNNQKMNYMNTDEEGQRDAQKKF